MEINKVTANPAVVSTMDAFIKEQNPRHELDMLQTLVRGRFMSPVEFSVPLEEGKEPDKDAELRHFTLNNNDNETFYMAFTDKETMDEWAKGEHRDFILLNLAELLALIGHSKSDIKGLVINPFRHNVTLTKEMLINLPKRLEELQRTVPPRFLLGKPKEEPVALEEALQKYFKKKQKSVQEAWMLMALREGTKVPRLMLIVDFEGEPEDAKEMFPAIIEEAKPYLKKDEGMDIVRRDEHFAEDILAKTEPFYQKKAGLFW